MEVILLERIDRLGAMGDVVRVKAGFARNFLLPQGKALRATETNRSRFEREREALEALNAERRDAASSEASHIDGETFMLIRQAGESGLLYGSVSSRDIAEAASSDKLKIGRSQVILDRPIKDVGLHEVKIRLHAEVTVTVTINVARTADEAERQAKGEDVIASQHDEDRAIADAQAAELFEANEEREGEGVRVAAEDEGEDEITPLEVEDAIPNRNGEAGA